jgi:hypothetical protein
MKLSEFKIGETFFCGGNTWRCTDVGSRIVSAIQVDGTDGIKIVSFENGVQTDSIISYEQAHKEKWFNGPPYVENDAIAVPIAAVNT